MNFFKTQKSPINRDLKIHFFKNDLNRAIKKRRPNKWKRNFSSQFRTSSKIINFKSLTISVVIGTIFLLIFIFFFSNLFRVKHLNIIRDSIFTETSAVKKSIIKVIEPQALVNGEIINSEIKGPHIFNVSLQNIEKTIKTDFPLLASVQARRIWPDTLQISLNNYPLSANFIALTKADISFSIEEETPTFEQKGLLNNQGYIITLEKTDQRLPTIFLIDQTKQLQKYDQVINPSHLNSISKATNIINEKLSLSVKQVKYYQFGREVHIDTNEGPTIWLDFEDSMENQLHKLIREISQFDMINDPPEYFDLRIKNRLIYK